MTGLFCCAGNPTRRVARAAFHVVAKSPIARLTAFARQRGWQHMSPLSTAGNCYDGHYFGDTAKPRSYAPQTTEVMMHVHDLVIPEAALAAVRNL